MYIMPLYLYVVRLNGKIYSTVQTSSYSLMGIFLQVKIKRNA